MPTISLHFLGALLATIPARSAVIPVGRFVSRTQNPHRRILLAGLSVLILSGARLPGAGAAPTVDFAAATLVNWVQPAYPESGRKQGKQGVVQVEFVVGTDGLVSQAKAVDSTDAEFSEAALAAVRQWTFHPALEQAKPAVSGMTVEIYFETKQLAQKRVPLLPAIDRMPHPLPVIPAKFTAAPDPDYPEELEERKLPGQVQIDFLVDETGAVKNTRVLWASHPAFVEKALRALEHTRFEPAHQGPVTKPVQMQYPVEFASIGSGRRDELDANHLSLLGDAPLDGLPEPFTLTEPVYPLGKLLAGESGEAVAEFVLTERGNVTEVALVSCSAPEFGAALLAAMDTWTLRPAMKEGARLTTRMRINYAFTPPTDGPVHRLVAALQPGGNGIEKPAGLDAQITPLWRGFPVYPKSVLARGNPGQGEATIEFVIDAGGRARLPRIVSASAPEFGWAAAMAISQWVFQRPMKNGVPVDVRVVIPVGFVPPKS